MTVTGPRLLIITVVHRPDDARILHRQLRTLRDDGFEVTYAAPWSAFGVEPPEGLATRDLPRAGGRRRIHALRAARRLLHDEAGRFDLVLLHDPELLVAARLAGIAELPPVVWDVHEDTAVALGDRAWVPGPLRSLLAIAVRRLERWAERHVHLLLAEDGYRPRFRRVHPVIRNHPWAHDRPALGRPAADLPRPVRHPWRVLYVGRLSRGRGLPELLALPVLLGDDYRVELAGPVDGDVADDLGEAVADGSVVWHGFVPNDRLRELLDGALVGLSLLTDDPNYRVSMPSKVVEYLAHGVPVVATPLPAVTALLEGEGGGTLVPFGDAAAAAAAVRAIAEDASLRERMVHDGLAAAAVRTWEVEGARLTSTLRSWARPRMAP
jgi:glycosyltransferase involved in cell wall biosynthesis